MPKRVVVSSSDDDSDAVARAPKAEASAAARFRIKKTLGNPPHANALAAPRVRKYGEDVCARRISILFHGDNPETWHAGVVQSYSLTSGKHLIKYDDGDQRWHDLARDEADGQVRWVHPSPLASACASSEKGISVRSSGVATSSSAVAAIGSDDDDDGEVEVVEVVRGLQPGPSVRSSKAVEVIELDDDEGDAADEGGSEAGDDACLTCGGTGELVLCDSCDAQHHLACVGLESIPEGDWHCLECMGAPKGKRRAALAKAAKTKSRKLLDDAELAESTKRAAEAERVRRELVDTAVGSGGRSGGREGGGAEARVGDAAGTVGQQVGARSAVVDEEDEEDGRTREGGGEAGYVLNPAEAAGDGDLAVHLSSKLAAQMKAHQKEAVRFLFDNLIVTVGALRGGNPGLGALLAHSMGLGKTLTTLALIDALLTSPTLADAAAAGGGRLRCVLVVAPATVLDNWLDEIDKWRARAAYGCFRVRAEETVKRRLATLTEWQAAGGVCIIGFEAFLTLTTRAATARAASPLLQSPGADLVVLDEGHRIKNVKSKQHEALSACATARRLILSGTPLQNNLLEYHAMLSFVRPGLLGTEKEFRNRFVNPIMNAMTSDASMADQRLSRMRMAVLHDQVCARACACACACACFMCHVPCGMRMCMVHVACGMCMCIHLGWCSTSRWSRLCIGGPPSCCVRSSHPSTRWRSSAG